MAQLTSLNDVPKLLKYVTLTLPRFFTKKDDSYLKQFISSICEVFKINIDQVNQMFNNTFISEAEDQDLDNLIMDLSKITRKDNENNEDYRERYYKYIFRYNATTDQINNIVTDILGYAPIKLTESGARTGYWGQHDLPLEERFDGTAYYYDDVEGYTVYWGDDENRDVFSGTIHLLERPNEALLNELIDVIERVRKKGTRIFLKFLDDVNLIISPTTTEVLEDAFTLNWNTVPSANFYEIQFDDDPLFGSPSTYITTTTSYTFSGLSGGVPYYTRIRYTNDDGDTYSDWTDPIETTTPSSIGIPIATEETNVTSYGFTANWNSAVGATAYLLSCSLNSDLSSPISGLDQLNVGNVLNYDINKITEERLLYMKGTSVNDYSGNIFSCKLDGTDEQQHTTTSATYLGATFLDNGDIVCSRSNGVDNKLYIIKKVENYSTEHELKDSSDNPLSYSNQHVKSANTINKIAYYKENPPSTTDLYMYDIDTKIETQLEASGARYYTPFWNNNDTFIYLSSINMGDITNNLYISKINTSTLSISNVMDVYLPSFLPTIDKNEQYLFYLHNSTNVYSDEVDRIRRYKLDGSENIEIVTNGTNTYYSMGINKANNKLYFCNKRSPHSTLFKLYKSNFDGTSQEEVIASSDAVNYYLLDLKEITYDVNTYPSIVSNATLYYGIKATDGVITSPYSNIITVTKPI